MGRTLEAITVLKQRELEDIPYELIRLYIVSLRALLDGNRRESLEIAEQAISSHFLGPEELFYFARQIAYLGEQERVLAVLRQAIDGGFFCVPALTRDPWLDPLRTQAGFQDLLQRAQARHREALIAFNAEGGDRVLGVSCQPRVS